MKKGYLGVMLDCSRNAVMSVAELKNFILTLKKTGYNCLQLYTEDTYEIEGEPQFGYRRGKYTKAELKEIDEKKMSMISLAVFVFGVCGRMRFGEKRVWARQKNSYRIF